MNIEKLIVDTIIKNEKFARRTTPYISQDLFEDNANKKLFSVITKYYSKYQKPLSATVLKTIVSGISMEQEIFNTCEKRITECFANTEDIDIVWLFEETNNWIRKRSVYNAVVKAVEKIETDSNINELPELFKEALSKGYHDDIGFDIFEDAEQLFDIMSEEKEKLPFKIKKLNEYTGGGNEKKTLTVICAPTNTGKSMHMCSLAADDLRFGRNVVYFSGEMSEQKICQRIYGNLLDERLSMLPSFNKKMFLASAKKMYRDYKATLIVKEYPTGIADTSTLRAFLRELMHKKGIVPDVVYVDYLNLFNSVRCGREAGSYFRFKAVAEELRGIAVEYNVPLITATQINKEGSKAADFDLTEMSESYAIAHTADLAYGIMETEELRNQNLQRIKILKNRLYENNKDTFMVYVEKPKMKVMDYNG